MNAKTPPTAGEGEGGAVGDTIDGLTCGGHLAMDPPFMRLAIDGHPAPIDGHGTFDVGYESDPFDLSWPEEYDRFTDYVYARVPRRIHGSGSITVLRHVSVRADPFDESWTAERVIAQSREYRGLAVQSGPRIDLATAPCGTFEAHPAEDHMITGRMAIRNTECFEERVLIGRVTLVGVLLLERIAFDLVSPDETLVEMPVSPDEIEAEEEEEGEEEEELPAGYRRCVRCKRIRDDVADHDETCSECWTANTDPDDF